MDKLKYTSVLALTLALAAFALAILGLRVAALAAGGRLAVRKTALDGVTVAVAELEWGLTF